jgi:alkanesulfonate monooxygenase SsuD/methylene tetrahydromethanopterin reductase-like flavin-dependent oxidoreductase (luciferase family)
MRVTFGLALDFWSTTKPLHTLLEDYAQLAQRAGMYGFNSVWAGESRFQTPEPGHVPSPLMVLAALAARTTLKLGTGVALLPIWHPLSLAYDSAMLDHITAGRFILGVGTGSPNLLARYGIPPQEMASRMDDVLRALKALWAGADHVEGKHFTLNGLVLPQPVQPGGPPIWIGGKIRRSVERAATYGDAWYAATSYHVKVIKLQAHRYREALAAQGRDPSTAIVATNRTTFVAETDEQARQEGRPYINQTLNAYARSGGIQDAQGNALAPGDDLCDRVDDAICFVGSPETCLHSIRMYHEEAGVNHFNLRVSMGNMPRELAERTVTLLGERVLPYV